MFIRDNRSQWNSSDSLIRDTRKPNYPPGTGSDIGHKFNDEQNGDEPEFPDTAVARAERLLIGSDENRKRRNDALFISKFDILSIHSAYKIMFPSVLPS